MFTEGLGFAALTAIHHARGKQCTGSATKLDRSLVRRFP
jgi:hypothetical protein